MNELVDVIAAVGEFVGDKLVAHAYPGGVGGGVEEGDIDKGGVVDEVVAHVGGFDALLPPVLPVKLAALPRHGAAREQGKDYPAGKKQAQQHNE